MEVVGGEEAVWHDADHLLDDGPRRGGRSSQVRLQVLQVQRYLPEDTQLAP
jgi:hypothetical protein